MSEIFLFHQIATTSGWNVWNLQLLIGLITSKKYLRVAKKTSVLKCVIQIKFSFYEILRTIQATEREIKFSKNVKR